MALGGAAAPRLSAMPRLRFLTAGESHGPSLTAILEGLPAGLPLPAEAIDRELARRQRGLGAGGRMRIERDQVQITGGVLGGRTTGAPLALSIANADHANWQHRDIPPMTVPRPGHADLTAAVKYGYRDLRFGLERASARETAARVAVGAACKALLAEFGIAVGGYVASLGDVIAVSGEPSPDPALYAARCTTAEQNDVRCPMPDAIAALQAAVQAAITARNTLGGVVELAAWGVPPGLGSHAHWDRRLDTRLAAALCSIPAVKGVEIGLGFAVTTRPGTEAQDQLEIADGVLRHRTNRAGGIEGGISNGAPLVLRAALKPIATTLTPQASVDLATGQPAAARYERSDICQVPRAVPIAEAMVAFEVADALLEKLGGDSLDELRPRFALLRRTDLQSLPMANQSWRCRAPE